jgi:hypothetical protein
VEQLQHVALDCAHRKLYSSLPKANICWTPSHKHINFIHQTV